MPLLRVLLFATITAHSAGAREQLDKNLETGDGTAPNNGQAFLADAASQIAHHEHGAELDSLTNGHYLLGMGPQVMMAGHAHTVTKTTAQVSVKMSMTNAKHSTFTHSGNMPDNSRKPAPAPASQKRQPKPVKLQEDEE